MKPLPIKLSRDGMHDLRGLSARFSAILTLIEDPIERHKLDAEQVDRDFLELLEKARLIWLKERKL
jgi:hypothetical protein